MVGDSEVEHVVEELMVERAVIVIDISCENYVSATFIRPAQRYHQWLL